jgi:hypothetical protein
VSEDERSTLQVVARHLAAAVEPLDRDFRDVESFRSLMWRLGWDAQDLPASYLAAADAALTAVAAAEALADDAELGEVLALVDAVGDVYAAVDGLAEAPAGVDAGGFLAEIARSLFEYLLAEYLLAQVPRLFSALELFGVIRFENIEPSGTRPGFVRTRFEWERIPEALGDPASIPADVLSWGTADFDFRKSSELLSELTLALGLPTSVDRVGEDIARAIQDQATGTPERPIRFAFTVPFFDVPIAGRYEEVGIQVTELPAEGPALPGVLIGPLVPDGIAAAIDLGNHWTFNLRAGTDLAEQLGIVLRPGEIGVRYPFAPGRPLPSAGFGIALAFAPDAPAVLFGDPGGIRLELAGATLSTDVDLRAGDLELKFGAAPEGLVLVLSAASLDGFLGSVLGAQELRIEAPLRLSWSNRTGLDFVAGAGLEVSLYPHVDFGVLRFDRIDLGLRFVAGAGTTPQVDVRAAAAFSGELGPVAYSVDRLGVHLPILFEDGNAGPFDVGFGVLWPTGLGLVVDAAGIVTGGGFVSLDPEAGRYVGILDLGIYEIRVTAIGILDTKDAQRRDLPPPGFSLLISISAEFPPIQLGYGFTLNGVGGLAAINRRMDSAAFLAGVRAGAVDSILFPEDPVANAHTIISNLTTIFPIAVGRYVFGPMAILGWGTPTIVRVELGVLIEVPAPIVLALVGQASVELPEDPAIVAIHLDVVGILDFGRSLFAVDASLRDSYVALYSIYGDMAMRLSWGTQPNFALSVGGLNPHFTAPPDFPVLRRVTVALGMGDNPRVSLEGYFAITSNSLQFGAKAELYAEAAGFSIKGWLGFDALLIFVPLSFRFDFSAGMGIYRGSSRIAGVTVEGHLTGPSPFHAWGKGCISLLFFDVCVPFDATFGERHENTLPPSDPWPLLEAAIRRVENWTASVAADLASVVTLRPPPDDPGRLLLHPMGAATLRQKVLPFNRTLERFGEFAIQGPTRYELDDVSVGATPTSAWTVARDHFAPGDFEALNETEKLSRPSFEEMDAGVAVGGDFVDGPLGAMKIAALEYETTIIVSPWDGRSLGIFLLDRALQLFTTFRGSKAFSLVARTGTSKFAAAVDRAPAVKLGAEEYSIATVATLEHRTDFAGAVTKGAAFAELRDGGAPAGLQVVPTHELEDAA